MGIGQNTYSSIENNEAKLKAEDAEKLARSLGISIADFLSEDNPVISFSNNTIENGYIHNHFEMQNETIEKLAAARDFEISTLNEEVAYLCKQNQELFKLVGKKS